MLIHFMVIEKLKEEKNMDLRDFWIKKLGNICARILKSK